MALRHTLLATTCDLYRPFSAGSPLATDIPCQLVAAFAGVEPRGAGLHWTHCLLLDADVDIRDGCSRTPGSNTLTYADGDKVVLPSGAGNTSYVVVWVETVHRGSALEHKRAYLMRHQAAWPGP